MTNDDRFLSVPRRLTAAFKDVAGWPIAVLAIGLAIALWEWAPDTTVKLAYTVPACTVVLIVAATFFKAFVATEQELRKAGPALPKVITAQQVYGDGSGQPLLLLGPSPLFLPQTQVSIVYQDVSGFEILIGIGLVVTVQANGYIPVRIEAWLQERANLLRKVLDQDKATLACLSVKPSVPINHSLPSINNGDQNGADAS